MGYRMFLFGGAGGGGTAQLWSGLNASKKNLNQKMRMSRCSGGDITRPRFGKHQNNNPDQRVPIPFTRGIAPRTDRIGARGWAYLTANVTPIG